MDAIELKELAAYCKETIIPRTIAFEKFLVDIKVKTDQERREGLSSDISYNRRRKEIENYLAQHQHRAQDQD